MRTGTITLHNNPNIIRSTQAHVAYIPMAEQCPGCGSFELDVDEVEGLVACTSCGRVVDESVVLYSAVQDDHVYVTGDGTQAAGRRLDRTGTAGRSAFGGGAGAARLRDTLERGASNLALPPAVLQDAKTYIEDLPKHSTFQYRPHPVTAGAAIYVACRSHEQPVTLRSVAAAVGIELKILASAYRAAITVLKLHIPAAPISAHVLKHGAALVKAQFPSWQEPARQHPVVRQALELLELLQLLHIVEGHLPAAVAGATLKIACNCHLVPGSGIKVPTMAVAKYVGLGTETINRTVSAVEKALIKKCQIIPAAKGVTQYNITNYTRLLISVYTLLPKLQQPQQPQMEQQPQGGA